MSNGYTYIGVESKPPLIDMYSQWLDLVNYLIGKIEAKWKDRKVYAHFDKKSESVMIFHKQSSARVSRESDIVWFVNLAANEIAKLDETKDDWSRGKKFLGWKDNNLVREDMEYALESLISSFVEDSDLLWCAQLALMKVDDISNGITE
jgi:hypothetical protein